MTTIFNLDVAVSSFLQLARHWNQGAKDKLELSCEDKSLHMLLSAVLGHPDQHYWTPLPIILLTIVLLLLLLLPRRSLHHSCAIRIGGSTRLLLKLTNLAPTLNILKNLKIIFLGKFYMIQKLNKPWKQKVKNLLELHLFYSNVPNVNILIQQNRDKVNIEE